MEDTEDDPPDVEDVPENRDKWHGYSDYQNVAVDLRKKTNRAISAYSHVQARSSQNVGMTPQTAVNTKGAILDITKRMFYEIEKNAQIDEFEPIYERWAGVEVEDRGGDDGKVAVDVPEDPGYVQALEEADFRREVPGWLDQLIEDLITAGWELGYIRAGVEKPADPDDDEEQVSQMFE